MGQRRSSADNNALLTATWPPASTPVASPARSIISTLFSNKSMDPVPFTIPALPVRELFSGVSNTVKGFMLNDNWWVLLLIIFLFFPRISNRMFGGLFKDWAPVYNTRAYYYFHHWYEGILSRQFLRWHYHKITKISQDNPKSKGFNKLLTKAAFLYIMN